MQSGERGADVALFMATSGHSGVDRVMRNLATEFVDRGLAVDLVKIRNHGPDWAAAGLVDHVRELPARHVMTALPSLVRYIRARRPRALMADKDRVNRVALLARRWSGVDTRLVVRIGTTVSKNLERRGALDRRTQLWSMQHLYPWADAVAVPSRGAAEDLTRVTGLPDSLIHVLPSPVLTPDLLQKANAPIPHPWLADPAIPVILGVGELSARKDFATLVRAFAWVRVSRRARLIILGRGRKRESLEALARELGVMDDVAFPGFVVNPYAYMHRAAIFVLSSVCEGAPVVLMEAMALGVPLVSTDCPSGPREILEDGRYGRLVPIGADERLATAITETLDSPRDREALMVAGARFDARESARHYLEVLGL